MIPRHLSPVDQYLASLRAQGGTNARIAEDVRRDLDRERLGWRYPPPRHRADRIDQMLANPNEYYREARERARAELAKGDAG